MAASISESKISDADILERWKDLVESGVAFEGPLQKLKSKARMLGSWNKRFFVLDYEKREFLYFASQSQARHPCGVPSGSVKFEDLLTARSTGTNLFQVEFGDRVMTLKAKDEAEKQRWLWALKGCILHCKQPPSNPESPLHIDTTGSAMEASSSSPLEELKLSEDFSGKPVSRKASSGRVMTPVATNIATTPVPRPVTSPKHQFISDREAGDVAELPSDEAVDEAPAVVERVKSFRRGNEIEVLDVSKVDDEDVDAVDDEDDDGNELDYRKLAAGQVKLSSESRTASGGSLQVTRSARSMSSVAMGKDSAGSPEIPSPKAGAMVGRKGSMASVGIESDEKHVPRSPKGSPDAVVVVTSLQESPKLASSSPLARRTLSGRFHLPPLASNRVLPTTDVVEEDWD